MSLSCTISEILSIISQNLKRSRDRDHTNLRGDLSIGRLRVILHMTNQSTSVQNLKSLAYAVLDIFYETKKFKMRHVTTPLSGIFVIRRLGLAVINSHIKFEVFMFIHYEHMKGSAKCRNWGGLGGQGSFNVTSDTEHTTSCSTLIETASSCTVFEL